MGNPTLSTSKATPATFGKMKPRAALEMASATRHPAPSIELVDVTPEIATEWLTYNQGNRALPTGKYIESMVRDMKEENWSLGADCIAFGWDGRLLNGQTRLNALVRANMVVTFGVIRNLDPEAQNDMDKQRRRSLANALQMMGKSNASLRASTTKAHYLWMKLDFPGVKSVDPNPSDRELLDWEEQHDFEESMKYVSRLRNSFQLPPSPLASVFYEMLIQDEETAAIFIERLIDGQDLREDDAIWRLRMAFARHSMASNERQKFTNTEVMALTIKSWNSFRKNKSVKSLVFKSNESFPAMD
jgi:hypothetical protein